MNTKLLSLLVLSAACTAGSLGAQTVQTTPAPAPAQAPMSAPNQTVYSQRLPSVDELSGAAAAQGLMIERIEQTAAQVTAIYKNNGTGQTTTVAYLLLPGTSSTMVAPTPPSSAAPAPTVTAPATTTTVVVPSPAPTVVYAPATRVIYYDDYRPTYYSYPRYWGPPVSIGLGFGFRSGGYYGGGHYHGGHRGHRH